MKRCIKKFLCSLLVATLVVGSVSVVCEPTMRVEAKSKSTKSGNSSKSKTKKKSSKSKVKKKDPTKNAYKVKVQRVDVDAVKVTVTLTNKKAKLTKYNKKKLATGKYCPNRVTIMRYTGITDRYGRTQMMMGDYKVKNYKNGTFSFTFKDSDYKTCKYVDVSVSIAGLKPYKSSQRVRATYDKKKFRHVHRVAKRICIRNNDPFYPFEWQWIGYYAEQPIPKLPNDEVYQPGTSNFYINRGNGYELLDVSKLPVVETEEHFWLKR